MKTRRHFVRAVLSVFGGWGLSLGPGASWIRAALAAAERRLLPRQTDLQSLTNAHPATLDTRELPVMPIESFQTMGPTDHEVSLDQWRLQVAGKVARPMALSYAELLALPPVEENVLLICPGIFTIHARWKGVTVTELLKRAGAASEAARVTVHGPEGPYEKVESFTAAEVASRKLFLAYAVNGQALPQKHGFPLRVVAADRYGSDWVKFVYKIEAR